eukprot:747175-Hanusia_phi.AAC.11
MAERSENEGMTGRSSATKRKERKSAYRVARSPRGQSRRGQDVCGVSRLMPEEVAEEVLARYGMDAIYLATDDPAVVEEAGRRQGVRYMTAPLNRDLFSNHMYIEHRLNLGVVDRKVRERRGSGESDEGRGGGAGRERSGDGTG